MSGPREEMVLPWLRLAALEFGSRPCAIARKRWWFGSKEQKGGGGGLEMDWRWERSVSGVCGQLGAMLLIKSTNPMLIGWEQEFR